MSLQSMYPEQSGQGNFDNRPYRRHTRMVQSHSSGGANVHLYTTNNDSIYCKHVCKTVRPMLSDRCHVCPVCIVGVLWPSGWMDQDETWRTGRPRLWPHCIRWERSSTSSKGHSPQFSAHICCGQQLDGALRWHLAWRCALVQATLC